MWRFDVARALTHSYQAIRLGTNKRLLLRSVRILHPGQVGLPDIRVEMPHQGGV